MASTYEALLLSQVSYLLSNAPLLYSQNYISSAVASINIPVPPGYNNVEVVWRATSTSATTAVQLYLQMNSDTTSGHYQWQVTQGNNTSATATTSATSGPTTEIQIATIGAASATTNYFSSGRFTVSGASDSTFKTVVGMAGAFITTSSMFNGVYAGQWDSTAAVTSLTLTPASGNLAVGSRFSLYVYN